METDNENPNRVESRVRELQANLFPPSSKICSSYFDNFLIKTNTTLSQDEDEGKDLNPKDFLSFNREVVFTPQQPRWPTECQVLEERVIHINYAPPSPEPYYNVTGKEVQPKPAGEECGLIVYQYIPMSAVNYFSRSSVGGSKYLLSTCICPEEDTLRFESRFESGNLARAIRITPSYYELYLRADLYTSRHMQWFYFRITNMKKNFIYRFAIVNLTKEESLFNEGMKPLMYSTKDSQLHSIGWRRCGDNITYYCNENVSPEDEEQQMTYTLTFTMEFPHENDEVYLAHSCPYTYSDLQDYLIGLTNHPVKSTFSTLRLLCKSLAGNNVYYLTITSPPVAGEIKRKKAIVVTARVHPGETPASWMMKGFIDFLTSDSMSAKELRDKFIFKLVPMLNPDGVVVGNNRCSLSAKDLNRQYRTVMRDAYPSIWYTKLMVRRLLEECGVAMYCDLHAHSRKHNIFIYGCESRRASEKRLQEQVFPLMLHKNAADKFSFENCQFRIQKIKEGTGRVVMWMMGIPNSYTMEATFAGSTLGTRADTHFSTQDLEQMGRSFCQTLLDFYDEDPRKERLRIKIVDRLLQEGSNADEPANIQLSDYSSDQGDTSCSSSEDVKDEDVANFFLPVVPPPSPILPKKQKPKFTQSKAKMGPKTPNLSRKYLPICKATLGLSSEESNQSSSDSENYIAEITGREKVRSLGRRRRKKKLGRIKQSSKNHTGTEMHVKTRSISVFDVMSDKPLPQSQRRSKTPLPRVDKRQNVSQELAQVQAKLSSLKHKLWYGVENGSVDVEAPLSWGRSSMTVQLSTGDMVISRNNPKIRAEKPTNARASSGVKHPSATDWMTSDKPVRIRKSSSLPDSTVSAHKPKIKTLVFSCDDGMKHDKKKKKAKSKLPKKVKNTTKMKITFD